MENRNLTHEMAEGQTTQLKGLKELVTEQEGMGTVEVVLIIVVLVGLVIVFKEQINKIVQNIFMKITAQTGKI